MGLVFEGDNSQNDFLLQAYQQTSHQRAFNWTARLNTCQVGSHRRTAPQNAGPRRTSHQSHTNEEKLKLIDGKLVHLFRSARLVGTEGAV